MNRSLYLSRRLDQVDRAIIVALSEDGRRTIKQIAQLIGMSSPSTKARVDKIMDAGAIRGYSTIIDAKVFGLNIAADVRFHARPGEVNRVTQMLQDTPEIVEANQVTGENCFLARVVVIDVLALQAVVAQFEPYASTDIAIILSNIVVNRLPKI